MIRLMNFALLKKHPYLCRDFKKLSKEEVQFCIDFIEATKELDSDGFVKAVNRCDLNNELAKFKNKMSIWALLLQSSDAPTRERRK